MRAITVFAIAAAVAAPVFVRQVAAPSPYRVAMVARELATRAEDERGQGLEEEGRFSDHYEHIHHPGEFHDENHRHHHLDRRFRHPRPWTMKDQARMFSVTHPMHRRSSREDGEFREDEEEDHRRGEGRHRHHHEEEGRRYHEGKYRHHYNEEEGHRDYEGKYHHHNEEESRRHHEGERFHHQEHEEMERHQRAFFARSLLDMVD
ncbi:uncharacterized protein FIBRA_04214 [Fibroporia radiculosa]|uniref:Uncharacterized protein n=1 Tax=Fibroporia radiculosa TaxID=599839 RepID=J4HWE8_9APHY|nr:uncharacterized protein FIBRA_04214 [Fibroporia radiculosa]CCM02137.1 predicted protein [Fibroporia radiculosa]